ncbi:hypothetical protein [Paraburkholderia diazotrophica]|uniref:hypothetical protein n=1 Tax=Paraburkholderia diazotrophica TaxID=667676 RepID=UPI003175CBF7
MQSDTQKRAKVAVFLHRSALFLLMLPVACFFWALHAYPPQDACWLCVAAAIYVWPVAGILLVIAAGFHVCTAQRLEKSGGLQEAHGL